MWNIFGTKTPKNNNRLPPIIRDMRVHTITLRRNESEITRMGVKLPIWEWNYEDASEITKMGVKLPRWEWNYHDGSEIIMMGAKFFPLKIKQNLHFGLDRSPVHET